MDVILGTAGHIDHGKTTLIRALTGIDCDRLKEEKRRGITIELGFAWMDLPDGRKLGIVDVPGHERFIKNMVAGAAGIDFLLLVIAADEGVMPQTREHLEICSLLGIKSGIIALTKIDQVDEDWLKFVREDVSNALQGTFLETAPVIPVSSATGEGLNILRQEIFKYVSCVTRLENSDIFRLPVDRIFSLKGFGTIVTGTIISGYCRQGENVCIMPEGTASRTRMLQSHNTEVEAACHGQRCAINLQNLEVTDIQRGDVVARPNTLFPSKSWIISLHCLKSSPLPIRQRMEVHFHHGAKECLAKIVFWDRELLKQGESCIAEVRFTSPMVSIYEDHYVLRAHSPLKTIGGGIVINPIPPVMKKKDKEFPGKYKILEALSSYAGNGRLLDNHSKVELVKLCLKLYPAPGLGINKLKVLTNLDEKNLNIILSLLEEKGDVFCWDKLENCWISKGAFQTCLEKCLIRVKELHKQEPLKNSFAKDTLVSGWGNSLPAKFTAEVLAFSIRQGDLIQAGTGFKLARHKMQLNREESEILNIIREKIKDGGYAPPLVKEIVQEQGWEIKKIRKLLNYLCEAGYLLKIQDGLYYDKEEFSGIMEKIRKWFEANAELDISNARDLLGISRKYVVPILEYLDSTRMTYRINNIRRLSKDAESIN